MTTVKARHVALLAILVMACVTAAAGQRRRGSGGRRSGVRRCAAPRFFRVGRGAARVNPLGLARGKVTVVALLTNTCPFCIGQARKLETLYHELRAGNGTVTAMMIIDGASRANRAALEDHVSFPVYTDDSRRTIWSRVFMGAKDDIFILNTCGQLTYRIQMPYSNLSYNYVRRALNNTINNRKRNGQVLCNTCSVTPQ